MIKAQNCSFYFLVVVLSFYFLLFTFTSARAENIMRSDNYEITWPNLNSGAGLPTSDNYNLGATIGQTAPGLYSSTGYKVRAGFQYIHSIIPFSFRISSIAINFGSLTPGTPSTQNSTLTVSVGGAGGYVVKAAENNPLTSEAASTIPDTLCDGSDCDETAAGVWASNSTYGFGLNMSGADVPADFVDATYFRQFADQSLPEPELPQTIMTGANVGVGISASVTYKVNVSSLQAAGTYRNMIIYLAIPTF